VQRACGRQTQILRNSKGFTIAELIVVLVLIILIIMLILPNLLDKIETAKMNAEIAESRNATVALQATLTLSYADSNTDKMLDKTDIYNVRPTKECRKVMNELVGFELGRITHIKIGDINGVIGFVYTTLKGSTVIFDDGEYTVTDLY
jgi:type II secretory pathway pseudopilin PulG